MLANLAVCVPLVLARVSQFCIFILENLFFLLLIAYADKSCLGCSWCLLVSSLRHGCNDWFAYFFRSWNLKKLELQEF